MHQVLEKVKNESFFKWPNKMVRKKSETETSIVNIIRIMAIQQRIAGVYGITWTNLPEKEN